MSSAHHPIAQIISGDWGDEYPNVRLVEREGVIGQCAEAYTEMLVYGSVDEEVAIANARLIAVAPDLLATCETTRTRIQQALQQGRIVVPLAQIILEEMDAVIAKVRGDE